MRKFTENIESLSSPIKIFLVDNHEVFRQGLKTVFQLDGDFSVVGEGNSIEDSIESIIQSKPNVILMDMRFPEQNGFRIAENIKTKLPDTSIIILTGYDSELYIREAVRLGLSGFLTKDCSRELLINSIKTIAHGGCVWDKVLFNKSLRNVARLSSFEVRDNDSSFISDIKLTPREIEILSLLAEGLANKEISTRLNLANVTVKKYVKTIMTKLGASNRTQVALLANRTRLC
jgi:DNA-binding NarL/FixJ family response regulator